MSTTRFPMGEHSQFDEVADRLLVPGMGTENVGPLLEGLVRLRRPRLTLELGAGYTTLFLLRAIADAHLQHIRDAAVVRDETDDSGYATLLLPNVVEAEFDPLLVTVDDFSDPLSSAGRVAAAAAELGLGSYLRVEDGELSAFAEVFAQRRWTFDLIWVDAGDLRDESLVLRDYWPLVATGGFVALHDAYLTVPVLLDEGAGTIRRALRTVPGPLLNELRRQLVVAGAETPFELLSVVEPNKHRQGSVVVLRKLDEAERLRPVDFKEEAHRVLRRPLDVLFDLAEHARNGS